MISSTMPSAKYSCSGSPLILANGITAIDGLSGSGSTPTLPSPAGGDWQVRYADFDLGYIHPQRRRLTPRPLRGVSKPGDLMEIADASTTTPQAQQPQHP